MSVRRMPPWALGLALVATLLAAWFAPEPDAGVALSERAQARTAEPARGGGSAGMASPVPSDPARRGSAATRVGGPTVLARSGAPRVLAVSPREAFEGEDAIFKGQAPVPDVPPVRAQPVAPVASEPAVPQLPVRLIGRYIDGVGPAAFVIFQDQNLVLRTGDVLAQHFRVEQIDEVSLTLRHLPSEQLQTVRLDAAP
jgi:hypothetical protein